MKNLKSITFLLILICVISLDFLLAAPESITIIHWNDFHSANLPYKPVYNNPEGIYVGGYANLVGYIDSLKRTYPDAITLNAGDDFQGSPTSSITKGLSQILILNEIMPTAFTLGNHEFDYGVENLIKVIEAARFKIISANIYDLSTNENLVDPYVIVEAGSIRIAIIGVILGNLDQCVLPENVEGIKVVDPLLSVSRCVEEVEDISDVIVVLSHCGFKQDSLLALGLSEVDVIVGGHSHTVLRQPVVVNNIIICQAGERGRFLGLLEAEVNKEEKGIESYNYKLIETELGKVELSKAVLHVVDSLELTIREEMDEVIGVLMSPWIRNSYRESNIGNWITDAMRVYVKADIAFQNSGGIRKDLPEGAIKVRDIWEIYPFDNTVVKVTLTGKQLVQLLEWRIANPDDFLQASGIKLVYDSDERKIISAKVNGKSIESEREYKLVTNNYITSHFEEFFGLNRANVTVEDMGIPVRDVLLQAVNEQKTINSKIENRIIDVAKNEK